MRKDELLPEGTKGIRNRKVDRTSGGPRSSVGRDKFRPVNVPPREDGAAARKRWAHLLEDLFFIVNKYRAIRLLASCSLLQTRRF